MRYLTATAASYRLRESGRESPSTGWGELPSGRRVNTQARSPQADRPEKRPHSEYTTHLFNQQMTWAGTFFLLTSGTLYGFGALSLPPVQGSEVSDRDGDHKQRDTDPIP